MGGQIMPPVMGAVAFIMAETINVPYVEIAKAAAIPAMLYFFTVFWMMHLEAGVARLKGLQKDQCPDPGWRSARWLLPPLAGLGDAAGFTPMFAGMVGLALTVVLLFGSSLAPSQRTSLRLLLDRARPGLLGLRQGRDHLGGRRGGGARRAAGAACRWPRHPAPGGQGPGGRRAARAAGGRGVRAGGRDHRLADADRWRHRLRRLHHPRSATTACSCRCCSPCSPAWCSAWASRPSRTTSSPARSMRPRCSSSACR